MMDGEKPAMVRRTDYIATRHRRQAQVASHQMQVIARQQNDLTGPDYEVLPILALDPDTKSPSTT